MKRIMGSLLQKIMPDLNNVGLNGFDIGADSFVFSINDENNRIQIPGTDITLHYEPYSN